MKLNDFFVGDSIIAELKSTDRNGVIRELVESLAACRAIDPADADTIARSVIHRESQGSTGFGKGVAVPHMKLPCVPKMLATVGRSSVGIDFAALDRAPVYTVVLLLSPSNDPDSHLAAMERIFRHLQHDNFRKFLRQADTKESIRELLLEADDMKYD